MKIWPKYHRDSPLLDPVVLTIDSAATLPVGAPLVAVVWHMLPRSHSCEPPMLTPSMTIPCWFWLENMLTSNQQYSWEWSEMGMLVVWYMAVVLFCSSTQKRHFSHQNTSWANRMPMAPVVSKLATRTPEMSPPHPSPQSSPIAAPVVLVPSITRL